MEASADGWDLVLRGGRVIDPESGLDAVRDVAVTAGRIAAPTGIMRSTAGCRAEVGSVLEA